MKNSDQYWDGDVEGLSRSDLESLQLERWQRTLQQVTASALYQKKYAEAGIHAKDLKTLDGVRKLPLTTKQDLREHYPYGLLCVPAPTGAATCLVGNHRPIDCRTLYPCRPRGWASFGAVHYMRERAPASLSELSGYGSYGGLAFIWSRTTGTAAHSSGPATASGSHS